MEPDLIEVYAPNFALSGDLLTDKNIKLEVDGLSYIREFTDATNNNKIKVTETYKQNDISGKDLTSADVVDDLNSLISNLAGKYVLPTDSACFGSISVSVDKEAYVVTEVNRYSSLDAWQQSLSTQIVGQVSNFKVGSNNEYMVRALPLRGATVYALLKDNRLFNLSKVSNESFSGNDCDLYNQTAANFIFNSLQTEFKPN